MSKRSCLTIILPPLVVAAIGIAGTTGAVAQGNPFKLDTLRGETTNGKTAPDDNPFRLKNLPGKTAPPSGGATKLRIPPNLGTAPAKTGPKPYIPPQPKNISPVNQAKQGQATGVPAGAKKPPPNPKNPKGAGGKGNPPSPQPMPQPFQPHPVKVEKKTPKSPPVAESGQWIQLEPCGWGFVPKGTCGGGKYTPDKPGQVETPKPKPKVTAGSSPAGVNTPSLGPGVSSSGSGSATVPAPKPAPTAATGGLPTEIKVIQTGPGVSASTAGTTGSGTTSPTKGISGSKTVSTPAADTKAVSTETKESAGGKTVSAPAPVSAPATTGTKIETGTGSQGSGKSPAVGTASSTASTPATAKSGAGAKTAEKSKEEAGAAPAATKEDTTEDAPAAATAAASDADAEAARAAEARAHEEARRAREALQREIHETAKRARAESAERAKGLLGREDIQPIDGGQPAVVTSDPSAIVASLITGLANFLPPAVVVAPNAVHNPCLGLFETLCKKAADKLADEMEKERKKLEKEARKELEKEHEKRNKRIEEERKKLEKEIKKRKKRARKDKRYREREARKDKLKKRRAKAREDAKKLRDRAKRIKELKDRYKRRDKVLREEEQKLRRNGDPNCRSAACRQLREYRQDNYRDQNNLAKEQGLFARDAAQFNADSRNIRREQRELDRLSDRGFGMNKKEFKLHRARKAEASARAREKALEEKLRQLQRRANNVLRKGQMDAGRAANFNKIYQGIEKQLDRARGDIVNAMNAGARFEADMLGLTEDYKKFRAADKRFSAADPRKDSVKYERLWKERGKEAGKLDAKLKEARRLNDMGSSELGERYSRYKGASDAINKAAKGLGRNFSAGKGKTLGEYSKLAKKYDALVKRINKIPQNKAFNHPHLGGMIEEAQEMQQKLDKLWPQAQADSYGKHVEIFNAEFRSNFPLTPEGQIDRNVVEASVRALAQQQMEFVKVSGELDAARKRVAALDKKAPDFKGSDFFKKQREKFVADRTALETEQKKIIGRFEKMGIEGSFADGQFQPKPKTWAAAKYWESARGSVKGFVENVNKTRKKVAKLTNKKSDATEYKPPRKTPKKKLTKAEKERRQAALRLRADRAWAEYDLSRKERPQTDAPTSLTYEFNHLERTDKRLKWLAAEKAAAPEWMTSFRKEVDKQIAAYTADLKKARKSVIRELGVEKKRLLEESENLDNKIKGKRADAFYRAMRQREETRQIGILKSQQTDLRLRVKKLDRAIGTLPKRSAERRALEEEKKEASFVLKGASKQLAALQKRSDERRKAQRDRARKKATKATGGKNQKSTDKKVTVVRKPRGPPLPKETQKYVDWLRGEVLPDIEKNPVASGALPGILIGLADELGTAKAKQIVQRTKAALKKQGLEFSGVALADRLFSERIRLLERAGKDDIADAARLTRANFLAGILKPKKGADGSNWIPTEKEKKDAQASLDKILPKLRARLEKNLRSDVNKPVKVLGHLSKLVELTALPESDAKDIGPLLGEIRETLKRVNTARQEWAPETVQAVKDLIGAADRALETAPANADGMRRALAGVAGDGFKALRQAADRKIRNAKGDDVDRARKEKALALLGEAKARSAAGSFKAALGLLNELGDGVEMQSARDAALIELVDRIEAGYGGLDADTRAALGDLKKIAGQRDAALDRLLKRVKDPRIIAAAATKRALSREAQGDRAAAIETLRDALKRSPVDPVLRGELLRLEALGEGANVSADKIASLLERMPEGARLPAALMALGRLAQTGEVAPMRALRDVLKKAAWVSEENKPAVDLQLKVAEISIVGGRESSAERDKALWDATVDARAALGRIGGMDMQRKVVLGAAIERVRVELLQAKRWRRQIKTGEGLAQYAPLEGYDTIAKAALGQGRLDIAEAALRLHAKRIVSNRKKLKSLGVIRETRKAVRVLDLVRKRLLDPKIDKKAREKLQAFVAKVSPEFLRSIDAAVKQRTLALRNLAGETIDLGKLNDKFPDIMAELRALGGLRARAAMAGVEDSKRDSTVRDVLAKANKAIAAQRAKMDRMFAKTGKSIVDNAAFHKEFRFQLSRLNALRAERDGIKDYEIDEFNQSGSSGGVGHRRSSVLEPKTRREFAIKGVHEKLSGVALNSSAARVRTQRKNLGDQRVGRGLREGQIINKQFERSAEREPSRYLDHWFKQMMIQSDIAYFDRRRQQLIRGDKSRSVKEKAKLFEKLLDHEARSLRGLASASNALSALNQRLTGVGDDYRKKAKEIDALVGDNQRGTMIDELRVARVKGEHQRAFRALVDLREASLAGEIKAFVDYTHVGWTDAGPARAANLAIGMDATQESLEFATAQAQRLNIALLRASKNLPSQLSASDQNLLRRQGFLVGDRYTFPKDIRIETSKVASEFVAITRTGALGAIDRIINVKETGKLLATVALPGSIAARFGQAVALELRAAGLARNFVGNAAAAGTGFLAEAAAFTGLSRLAQAAIDPDRILNAEMWTGDALWKEYTHNLAVIGALKVFGKTSQGLRKLGDSAAKSGGLAKVAGRSVEIVSRAGGPFAEAALLTQLNAMLENNTISRESYFENLATIGMLKATGKLTHKKPADRARSSSRVAKKRVAEMLREQGKDAPPPPLETSTRVGRSAELQARHLKWIQSTYLPERQLMQRFNGSWDAARSAYQSGKLSAKDMKALIDYRKRVVDGLTAEITRELSAEVQAFGSENLTSDYDISFVGPKAQAAVILFNARFKNRWGAANGVGGSETGTRFDTNAYTGTEHSNIRGRKGDVWFQDAYAHLSARKYLGEKSWSEHRKHLLDRVQPENRAELRKTLDWVEARNREFRDAIDAQKAEINKRAGEKLSPEELQIAAENRLYEAALKEIIDLKSKRKLSFGGRRAELGQQIRNVQSKALYFAQEAYQTQAAIEHVVFTIQAAKRKITVKSLLARGPPKLDIPLTKEQGRQSYLEQIANMLKQINHEGKANKLSAKAAKYFLRALDAAKIAGIDLAGFKSVVEATVEVEANRADVGKVAELLKSRFGEKGGEKYLELVREATNRLSGELVGGEKGIAIEIPAVDAAKSVPGAKAPPGPFRAVQPAEAPGSPKSKRAGSSADSISRDTAVDNRPIEERATRLSPHERKVSPRFSDLKWIRDAWIEHQDITKHPDSPELSRRLGLLEDITDHRVTLTSAEKAIADRAYEGFQRLAKRFKRVADLGDWRAFLQFNLHARADGITPEALIADFIFYNGQTITVRELSNAMRGRKDVARRALDRAEAKIQTGTKPDTGAAPPAAPGNAAKLPSVRVVGTPVDTPNKMPTVQRQEICNSCGVAAARSVIQRLIGHLFPESALIHWSKLTGKGFVAKPGTAGGTWPKGIIELLERVPGISVRVPYGKEFSPGKLDAGGDVKVGRKIGSDGKRTVAKDPKLELKNQEFGLEDAAREIRNGAQVLAVVAYKVRAPGQGEAPHWVVIEKITTGVIRNAKGKVVYKGEYVVIGDPAYGTSVAIPRAEFMRHWHRPSTVIASTPVIALPVSKGAQRSTALKESQNQSPAGPDAGGGAARISPEAVEARARYDSAVPRDDIHFMRSDASGKDPVYMQNIRDASKAFHEWFADRADGKISADALETIMRDMHRTIAVGRDGGQRFRETDAAGRLRSELDPALREKARADDTEVFIERLLADFPQFKLAWKKSGAREEPLQIDGVPKKALPVNRGGLGHRYPPSSELKSFLERGADLLGQIRSAKDGAAATRDLIADYYHVMINANYFRAINQSLLMAQVNYMLRAKGIGEGGYHGYIDFLAYRLGTKDFRKIFDWHVQGRLPDPSDYEIALK